MDKGMVILLNGASSSGKTSLAIELQKLLEPVFLRISLDTFYAMLPPNVLKNILDENLNINKKVLNWSCFLNGFYNSVTCMAKAGNNVILDCLCSKSQLQILENYLGDIELIPIGVKCSLGELEKREKNRGTRKFGLAKKQHEQIHKDQLYDFEIDTTNSSPSECALQIAQWVRRKKHSL